MILYTIMIIVNILFLFSVFTSLFVYFQTEDKNSLVGAIVAVFCYTAGVLAGFYFGALP